MCQVPGLFFADRQTVAEGLPEFYRSRRFTFTTYHRKLHYLEEKHSGHLQPFNHILQWLDSIDSTGQKNIRYLCIIIEDYCSDLSAAARRLPIQLIHEKISDKAMVVYKEGKEIRAKEQEALWTLGQTFRKFGVNARPEIRVLGQYVECSAEGLPAYQRLHAYNMKRALTFHPGRMWFKSELELELVDLLRFRDVNRQDLVDLENMSQQDFADASVRIQAEISLRQSIMAKWEGQDQDRLEAVQQAATRRQQKKEVMAVRRCSARG
ncbi:hypothetical protein P7C71_g6002, partial [Lecanoromycetidae sp. Uapishka_2]